MGWCPQRPHPDEAARLVALRRAGILDTEPEPAFDDLVSLASRTCATPIALIALVDERRQWIKAGVGFDVQETPREVAFCAHTILDAAGTLVVEDTHVDTCFRGHPLVHGSPFIRFYAGVPIVSTDGWPLGALCVIDVVPRKLADEQIGDLRKLARQVAAQVELRAAAMVVRAAADEAGRARTTLEAERAQLRGVLRAATEYSIVGTAPDGVIRVFNEGAERLTGYRAEEVLGRATPAAFHDAAEIAARAAELGLEPGFDVFVAAARRGLPETREWTYVCKDGRRVPVSLTVTAIRDDAGAITGFIGIARDITEERRAEKARARLLAERSARTAAESALDRLTRLHGVAVALAGAVTPAQVVEVVVEQGMAALGASTSVVALLREDGETLEVVAAVGRLPEVVEAHRTFPLSSPLPAAHALQRGAPVFVESLEAEGPYGGLLGSWLAGSKSVAAAPLLLLGPEGEGRRIGAFCLSFTEPRAFRDEDRLFLVALGRVCAQALERARLYDAEARARAEAEAANSAKDEFLSSLSHELRTPLTAVLGWARMLLDQPADPAKVTRGLTIIERNAKAQLRLIEDILDVSRIVANKLELQRVPVDVGALVQAAIDAARPAAEAAGIALSATFGPGPFVVRGDADRIQQIVGNLLSNAIKFTPEGGRVTLLLDRQDGHARVCVSDTGRGIEPDFLPHVFERFRQADDSRQRAHGGLGLGLSIADHLVRLHGGRITAESEGPGRGATFTVLLPIAPAGPGVRGSPPS